MIKPLCVVSCPILCVAGYGYRSRDFVKALMQIKGNEWDIKVLPQRWGATPWILPEGEEAWIAPLIIHQLTQQPDYWFQITIPNEAQPIGKLQNVLVTAGIETTICDPSWIEGINRMNLTLVSSEHAKNVFEQSTFQKTDNRTGQVIQEIKLQKPVEVLFEGVDLSKYSFVKDEDLVETEMVQELDNIQEDFCFLFVGHWLSGDIGEDRKNVGLTIKTFLETFKDKKKKPALILKTARGTNSIMDRDDILSRIDQIRKMVKSKDLPNIYLLHGELDDSDMNRLYNHNKVKAMLGLVKGEGYFRPLSEFFLSKKPAIVSAWSGHMDFCNKDFAVFVPGELTPVHPSAQAQNILIAESRWFSPDMSFASKKMVDMFENYSKYTENAKRQAHFVKENFSFQKMVDLLSKKLDTFPKHVAINLPKLNKLELPKLSKVTE